MLDWEVRRIQSLFDDGLLSNEALLTDVKDILAEIDIGKKVADTFPTRSESRTRLIQLRIMYLAIIRLEQSRSNLCVENASTLGTHSGNSHLYCISWLLLEIEISIIRSLELPLPAYKQTYFLNVSSFSGCLEIHAVMFPVNSFKCWASDLGSWDCAWPQGLNIPASDLTKRIRDSVNGISTRANSNIWHIRRTRIVLLGLEYSKFRSLSRFPLAELVAQRCNFWNCICEFKRVTLKRHEFRE